MTISPRTASTSLEASSTLLRSLAPRVAQGVGACRQMIESGGLDIERREDAGIRGKGWITDPTGQMALARLTTSERTLDNLEAYLETIRTSITLLLAWVDEFAPTVTDHPRCHATGNDSVQPWARPDCTELVAYSIRNDGSMSYRGDGLCDRCRMAKSRHDRTTAA